jgi:hypothetical protein
MRREARNWPAAAHHAVAALSIAVWALAMLHPHRALAVAEVTVKGTVMRGEITSMSAKEIEFEPANAKGSVSIQMEDIEEIRTDAPYHVLYGDNEEAVGRIVGYREGAILVGETPESAQPIEVAQVFTVISDETYQKSWVKRLRTDWRYWSANFDLGYSAEDATTDTQSFSTGLGISRKHDPTRFYLNGEYRYGTQKERDKPQTLIKDYAHGGLRGEYDVASKIYTFAAGDATYDGIQRISIRGVPKGGVGYKFYETKTDLIQGETGLAWVYERYFGGAETNYVAVAFGLRIALALWYDTTFTWNTDYLPAVDNWTTDYLIRTEAALLVPVYGALNLKLGLLDTYNNKPAPNTDRNSLATTVGVSFVF